MMGIEEGTVLLRVGSRFVFQGVFQRLLAGLDVSGFPLRGALHSAIKRQASLELFTCMLCINEICVIL
jgi:hypothetical protein